MSDEKLEGAGQAPEDEQTKAELYDLAKEADIEGRSSMDKEELAEAVEESKSQPQAEGKGKPKGPTFDRNPEGGPLITK